MKILSLRLKNINSFKEDLYLDFTREPLRTTSLFAITGPTGSGKTTLLDAICVALYNKTPRLDGKGNKSQVNLLSQGTDEGFSEVVFQVDGTKYLAEWRAKRGKKGDIKPSVKLINADTGSLITGRRIGRSSKDMADLSVEDAVTKILGMDFGAFKRSILLAQGEFASFLKADAEKKREILEATTGMDLYEQLKVILNQQVRVAAEEFGKVEAALDAIPAASPEEIKEAREELAGLEAALQQLSVQKSEVGVEKEREQLRVDAHKKLEESRKLQLQLTSRRDEIEDLKAETERALKAADIRSELDSYLSEKGQLEDLQVQLDKTLKELEEAGTRFEAARSEYEISSHSFEKAKIEADEKRKSYDQAAVFENEGKGRLQEAEKKREEAGILNQKIGQRQNLIQQKRDEIFTLEEASTGDRSFLEQHPLPDNVESLLAQASEVAARLEGKEDTQKQIKEALQKAEAACHTMNDKLSIFARDRSVLETHKTRERHLLENNTRALQPLIAEGDEAYWRIIRSAWIEVQNVGDELLESYDTLASTFEGIPVLTESQHEFNKTLATYGERMERLTLEITAARESLERCEVEEKLAVADNQAFVLRQEHLREGEPCPVCGSIEHPRAQEPEPDTGELIEAARRNVEAARSDLEISNEKFDTAGRELTGLARERIKTCDEKILNIESLNRDKVKIEHDLRLLDEKIQGISSQEETLNQQKETIKQEMDMLSAQIAQLGREITEHRTHLLTLIPEPGPPETAIEMFKALIRSVRQAKERLEENGKKLAEHRTSVLEVNRYLEEDITRHERLLEEYAQYKLEGDNLMAQVMDMTDGLGVDAARSALDVHIKDLEKQRDKKRSFYEQTGTEHTGLRSKVEGLEKDHDRLIKRFAAAESRYFQAIETSGFKSMEDHSSSFRDQDWLAGTKKMLEQYRQDVHTVEENIKIQQAVFAQNPYDPRDLQTILQKELALNNSIDEKNNLKGDINRKIKTLAENLQKRMEQEQLLDKTKKEMDRWQKLAQVMPANSLRDFALQTMFDLLIRFANHQLSDITSRYALKAKDMKDMVVIDRWNAGEERPVETLSGGESFLVSLSLALALSELSRGRSRLESLFLDEGFGTLDPETLDSALYALESLRLSGRTIGVISHVDQLTRRIPVRIEVKKTGDGTSRIQIKG